MPEAERQPVRLADYRPPDFLIGRADLHFDLDPASTLVRSRLHLRRNPAASGRGDLVLDGEDLVLEEILVDGRPLADDRFRLDSASLTIFAPPDSLVLETVARTSPAANTRLEGLYVSGNKLCTQCEAEGFRRITWFIDRPDVLSRFQVTMAADRGRYPVLLANGNLEDSGDLSGGRHWARWVDPFPKPCYLFALVAGDLVRISDTFRTASGRDIRLEIYVEPHNRDRCGHAMWSLKKAMAWDEEVFGLECDLDQYMIVAVDDFNMGAMENKGLNIFNSRYVLASPETATDSDFENITAVIGHEYFHNWTGNRVTCRDWFQLSLKEGLTVYRDQEFTADTFSRGVKRVRDARLMTAHQFAEDAGPLAHPVRPSEYLEINNFYTLTVYEKGAELVRMFETLLGRETFIAGIRRYIEENDGTAATVEDFVRAMEEVSGRDLSAMLTWYGQAGTPDLEAETSWDREAETLTLRLSQHHQPSPGQPEKRPAPVPVSLAMFTSGGEEMTFIPPGGDDAVAAATVVLTEERGEFVFSGVRESPRVSLLRGFSAPVRLRYSQTADELALILASDNDPYARWRAGHELCSRFILAAVREGRETVGGGEAETIAAAWARLLDALPGADCDLLSLLLRVPDFDSLAGGLEDGFDPVLLATVRDNLAACLARMLAERWDMVAEEVFPPPPYRFSPETAGRRRLAWLALDYLARTGAGFGRVWDIFASADNMSDELAALTLLLHRGAPESSRAVSRFLARWENEPLLVDKLLAARVTVPEESAVAVVEEIIASPFFKDPNPNRLRAVLSSFASGNPIAFHRADGRGYRLLAGQVAAVDRKNPQTASRLFSPLSRWQRYDPVRAGLMRECIDELAAGDLSADLAEVVEKSRGLRA